MPPNVIDELALNEERANELIKRERNKMTQMVTIKMTQNQMNQALEFYLNQKVLKNPVAVSSVMKDNHGFEISVKELDIIDEKFDAVVGGKS